MAVEPVEARDGASEASSTHDVVSEASSHVRSRTTAELDPRARAERRVAEFLRAQGLNDEERVLALAEELAEEARALPDLNDAERAQAAVSGAQARVAAWKQEVFGSEASSVDPLWLRAFTAAFPKAFLADADYARLKAQAFGDPRAGRPPTRAQFHDQAFRPARIPGWFLGLLPTFLLTAAASILLVSALAHDGLSALELVWTGLFSFLFGLGAVGLSAAVLGAFGRDASTGPAAAADSHQALPRTALVMPIYHESPEHVFAALLAMREALANTPQGDTFEMFVLSDSRDPERAAEEERAFRRVAALGDARIPIYYRRRARNDRQKAGNLAEFFERFGHRYTYAVVLDADSLMRADTLVELVARMEAAPGVALLQAPLSLHGGRTLFARAQQLAASVHGPLFTRGLAVVAGPHGNYFGHNAIVRVRAFLECCALPVLAGEPPLGGHILSHDFVEAALLCRAGWEVRIAHDLHGSWEELPPTLPEYVARDRRWCQGNLQHLRIALSEGLKPMSRVHMLVGASAYLAGPAWLAFLAIGVVLTRTSAQSAIAPGFALGLSGLTLALLLGPRVLGWLFTLRCRERCATHGGALRLTLSVVVETLFAALLAPVLMLHHARIVTSILVGRAVRWGTQKRHAGGEFAAIVRSELLTTLLGLASGIALTLAGANLVYWLSPVWVPWLLAIPLSWLASSEGAGDLSRKLGLWTVPSESAPDELITRTEQLRSLTACDESARFRDLVLDPVLLETHLSRLGSKTTSDEPTEELVPLCRRALRIGPAGLTASERASLSADASTMRWLHREAWRTWPVETWQLGRDLPQLPTD